MCLNEKYKLKRNYKWRFNVKKRGANQRENISQKDAICIRLWCINNLTCRRVLYEKKPQGGGNNLAYPTERKN